jgi:3D (Asp-Asp-Asp) domain-containing protein
MYKTTSLILLAALAALLVVQQQNLRRLRTEVEYYRQALWETELHMARTGGELSGLRITSGVREQRLGASLSRHRDRVAELQHLLQVKDHMIDSLLKGRMLTISAYSPEPAQTDDTPFITASNSKVREGIVAVSRDLYKKGWKFGREIYIKGLGVFTVEDLMHARKRNQVDVFMFSKDRALRFGRQQKRVYLLGG